MGRVRLPDGACLEIRPIGPEDRDALADGFERLSPESRYRRFFGPMPRLSDRDLDYFTRVDHHDHEALIALDADTGAGVGVARFFRTTPEAAEPAMVVVDEWQGRGVAGELLDALVERAREEGIRRFEAPVLATNPGAIRSLERLGDTTIEHDGREVHLSIALPEGRPRAHPVLRQFASGALQPARTVLDRLWPRRRGRPGDARRNVVVVGTDDTPDVAAVEAAATLAGGWGAAVHVVGVRRFFLPQDEDITSAVHGTAAGLRERGLQVEEHVRRGDAALVLAEVAADEDARLLVVGAGGRGQTARRLVGSVADSVAERAPCDVLIARGRGT